jgi:PilX N-terminal
VRHQDSTRGSALLVAMLMLMALAFIGAALVVTTSSDLKSAGEERRGTQAEFVAEAGIQEAMHRLAMASGTTVTVNGQTFDPSIRDTSVPYDPNWEARIYVPSGTALAGVGSVHYMPTVQSTTDMLDYASDSQFVRISHKWRDRDGDGVRDADEVVRYDPAKFPPENFDTGSPIEVIDVEGQRAQARRRLQVETTRYPFSPNVLGALSSDRGVDVRGNVSICGHDHRADTPVNTDLTSGPCSPNWDQTTGHRPAITTTGDPIDRRGSSDLNGSPTVTDTSSTNPFYSLPQCLGVTQDVIDQILANPDHTSASDSPLDGISYFQGNAHITNTTGEGLLYVTGDLAISGSFEYKGLIYVEGDLSITGTPWILGGVIVRGHSNYAFSGGSPAILYSSEMIRLALEASFNYVVLSWKEM